MPVKQGSDIRKSGRVFGQGQKAAKMVRASLYDRISTHDQQTLPMQIRGPGDKSSSLALENRAMREYASPAWLDHRPAGERSRLWSFPAATAGEVALKDIASQRSLSGLYSATAEPGPSTKQPACTLFIVCENDLHILLRQSNPINSGLRLSGRARWYGVIYTCMLAEPGLPGQTISWLAGHRVSRS